MFSRACRSAILAFFLGAAFINPSVAQESRPDVETAWRLLDYIAVDYGGAVSRGRNDLFGSAFPNNAVVTSSATATLNRRH